jgi:hypothetical protein
VFDWGIAVTISNRRLGIIGNYLLRFHDRFHDRFHKRFHDRFHDRFHKRFDYRFYDRFQYRIHIKFHDRFEFMFWYGSNLRRRFEIFMCFTGYLFSEYVFFSVRLKKFVMKFYLSSSKAKFLMKTEIED